MFGGFLGKLLLLVLVVAAVWFGWRYVQRLQQTLAKREEPKRAPKPEPRGIASEDMVKCRACGAYVAAAAGRCGRADCPF